MAEADEVKGQLSKVASTARLLLHQWEGPTFESVLPGYQAALDSHEAVKRQFPGIALVQAATNAAFRPPHPPAAHGSGSSTCTATP